MSYETFKNHQGLKISNASKKSMAMNNLNKTEKPRPKLPQHESLEIIINENKNPPFGPHFITFSVSYEVNFNAHILI